MPWADVNGVRMYYESHGEGDAVVFAHGAGGNHLSWWQQVPVFASRYRCVTFDHRGFGQTREVEGGPGAPAYPDDLCALLDHLGIESAWLVAQSMGGRTCMGFAVEHPHRVKGLLMADTMLGIDDPELREVLRAARDGERLTLERGAYDPSFRERRPDLAFLYDSIMALNPPRDALIPGGTAIEERHRATREKLATLGVRMLFLAGDRDALIAPKAIELAASFVPGARYVQVDGAGHSVYFEKADEFNAILRDFLEGR